MKYVWQEYSYTFNCNRLLVLDLLRIKLLSEYEEHWLCGKPVGGARPKSELPLFTFSK